MTAKRTDSNQKQIVNELRKIGCSVFILSNIGHGLGDILVGYRNKNYLFEIKKNKKCKLTPDEKEFHDKWRGHVSVITSIEEVLSELDLT